MAGSGTGPRMGSVSPSSAIPMTRILSALCLAALACSAMPAQAQLGGLRDRARRAVENATGRGDARSGRRLSDGPSQFEASRAREAAARAALEASPERQEAIALARELMEVYARHKDQMVDLDPSHVRELTEADLARVEALEATFPEMQAAMLPLAERWGDGDYAAFYMNVEKAFREMEIDESDYMETDGTFRGDLDWALKEMAETIADAAEYRQLQAAGEVPGLRMRLDRLRNDDNLDDNSLMWAGRIRDEVNLALRYDPSNPDLNELRAETAELATEMETALREQIAAARWPGHAAGAPTQHARAVLDYLRGDDRWGQRGDGYEVLAVAVRGGWRPVKHNILGQVIQWGLPVAVAATKPDWREDLGAARVYELTMLAPEGLPAPQRPPFDAGYWVGLHQEFVPLDRIPNQ